MKKIVSFVILLVLISSLVMSISCGKETGPLKIGVLLPLTGPEAFDVDEVLDWAVDNINTNRGINNRQVELVYKDLYQQDVVELAQEFIEDESIKIVIGPDSSAAVYEVAPMFIKNKKILVSPTSTAGDIFRAFGGKNFIWRTCQSDVAQIRAILHILSSRSAEKISLICEDSIYGKTFFDWAGFFSIELGIELLNLVKFEPGQSDFSQVVSEALEGDPEYIVCAAFSLDAAKIKKELDKRDSPAKLFLTDAAQTPYLIKALGEAAEGLEGITPAGDKATGFRAAYESEFRHSPLGFAATTYDAFLLSAYTLARQEYKGEEGIEESLKNVVSGRGMKVGWQEMNKAIELILQGELPDISGASGSLEFDKEFGVDPLQTFYSHWRVEGGAFRTVEPITSDKSLGAGVIEEGASASRARGSKKYGALEIGETHYIPKERMDLWAVIIATSSGWENYRHQSDALAMYNLLKDNGVSDNKIILFLIDDIANDPKNPMKGDVHHTVGGKNLRENAAIDYSGGKVLVQNLKDVLLGNETANTPAVLQTNENSNIFVFIVNHGARGYIPFARDFKDNALFAEDLNEIIGEMYQNKRYRQMFIMVEVCHGESMARDLQTPGVVYFTGAAKNESSFGTNYDRKIRTWLADDFTYQTLTTLSREQDLSIEDLYTYIYGRVAGSHVRLKNYSNFGDISYTSISEFISP